MQSYASADSPVKITHLKNAHLPAISEDKIGPSVKEAVAMSQYAVAKIILENPNNLVLMESLSEDRTPENKDPMMEIAVAIYFPNGLPNKFEDLNDLQKEMLSSVGGVVTLYYLNKLDFIYKTTTKEEQDKIEKWMTAQFEGDCPEFNNREKLAVTKAKEAAIKHQNNNILIVYGASHDFQRAIEQLNDKSIVYAGSKDANVIQDFTKFDQEFNKNLLSKKTIFASNQQNNNEKSHLGLINPVNKTCLTPAGR